jgi:CelD/BcsL family acetyltransferase involved in cellulose biosynthesis
MGVAAKRDVRDTVVRQCEWWPPCPSHTKIVRIRGIRPNRLRAAGTTLLASVRGELLVDLDSLEELREEWEELADAARRPFASPAWSLAWWRHASPPGARLRVAVARDAERLVAVAPFFAAKGPGRLATLMPLASGASHRGEPVGLPGHELEAAPVLAAMLAETGAQVVRFQGVAESSPWPQALASGWPGRLRPRLYRDLAMPAPFVSLAGRDLDSWLRSRSSNFRSSIRRHVKRGDEVGASIRRATDPVEARRSVRDFARLHRSRWASRGGSGVLDGRVEAMLIEAVEGLLAYDRLRLYLMEVDGRVVGADLFVAAGGEASYWLGGFDDAFARLAPSIRNIYTAVEEAIGREDRRLDLGAGGQEYKYRFADGEEQLEWWVLVPGGRGSRGARVRLLPSRARRALSRRLSTNQKALLRRILRR